MTDTTAGPERGLLLYERHRAQGSAGGSTTPREFELLGQTWDLSDGVFSPAMTPVTGIFTSWLPYPQGGSFLEIGCGAGVTAVVAAQRACSAVTATDLSEDAVTNTALNVRRHGVGDRVRVLHSDLFEALGPDERFDLIYWNSNFAEPPSGFVNETPLHHAFFDPGYETHRRFVTEAPSYLSGSGRLMLGFSSIGNWPRLRELCAAAGLRSDIVRSQERQIDATRIQFQLLELSVAEPTARPGAGA
jgi:release factor glutamine methyltransferase